MPTSRIALIAPAAACLLLLRFVPVQAQAPVADVRQQILSAEDRRAPTDADLRVLRSALADPDPAIQRVAVRALGRLERAALVPQIAGALTSSDAEVRAEAANALAQAVSAVDPATSGAARTTTAARNTSSPIADVQALLQKRLEREANATCSGVICESLGRLPYSTGSAVQTVEHVLVAATYARPGASDAAVHNAPLDTLVGAVKGLEALLRRNAKLSLPSPATIERLRALATSPIELTSGQRKVNFPGSASDEAIRVRALSLLALGPSGNADSPTLRAAMEDAEWEVRRVAVRVAGAGLAADDSATRNERLAIVMRGLSDTYWHVRYEALTAFGRNQRIPECRVLLGAVADPNLHVSLLAVDLAAKCAPPAAAPGLGRPAARPLVDADAPRIVTGLVRQLPPADGPWHRPAHALVSLAALAPDQAGALLGRFASHPVWQVRAYAARAAASTKAADVLRTLAGDANDNVRTAAVTGLSQVEQHGADEVFITQLKRSDYQLVMTAARALKGTEKRESALPALLDALAALTGPQHDTSRDARLALLERIGELGSADQAKALEPYVRDFDPRIGSAAAAILKRWTGVERKVPATGAPAAPPPAFDDVHRLEEATAVVRMKNGTSFTLTLLPSEAPASVARFVRLARSGYYNGLTFHRVEPVALIQGGSPGANEYAGDGPFMRDELGLLSNRRGSVGISTRGRDTGDAQWYINLVDNARYDHNYTVFAFVSGGMDAVDAILEGDLIEEVRIVPR